MAMFVGGSGGSTGGAIRIVRWIVVKAIRRELFTTTHPDAVRPVRLGGHVVDEAAIRGIFGFTVLYAGLFVIGSVLVGIDAARIGYELTAYETASAVAATLGNVGPGVGSLGPFGSYLAFSPLSKLLMVFLIGSAGWGSSRFSSCSPPATGGPETAAGDRTPRPGPGRMRLPPGRDRLYASAERPPFQPAVRGCPHGP